MRCYLLAALLLPTIANAHETATGWKYPVSCCSNQDCALVDPSAVRETRKGYIVTISPGTHPMWPINRKIAAEFNIPYNEGTPSPDGKFHICISSAGARLCFFAPLGGV